MVLTGPMPDTIATLFDPIRFIALEIKKQGITVATMANKKP